VPGFWKSFEECYLRVDRRVLGVFRVALSLVLLYDLLRRWPDATMLWSDDGLLTSASLHKVPQAGTQVSFLFDLSGPAVQLAFVGLCGVFLLYGLGLFTRAAQLLALVGYAGLNARNLFFEDGGTGCVILLLGWTSLLPLGDRFSVDAVRREAGLTRIVERVGLRAQLQRPVVTLAALAILLQSAVIYWLNALHKTGHTWRSGDAVHLVFWQHRVNTPFALWLSAHEPTWFSPLSSWLTKRVEFLLPVLLLWPANRTVARSSAFVLAVLLHGGIAAALTLGPFSYAMICLVWLAVPGAALDFVLSRVPRRYGARFNRYCALLVRVWRRRLGGRAPGPTVAAVTRRRAFFAREAVLGYMLLVEGASVLSSNRAIPPALRVAPGALLRGYKPWLRGNQGWSMFAPEAPVEDGTLVVDAVTRSGRHIDPFTGAAPNFEQIRRELAPHAIAVSDYFFAMRDARNSRYRLDLARYLRARPVASPQDRLTFAEFWWVRYTPPPRGSYEPGPIHKDKLWKTKL
jgi:hypothetical protein